MKTIKEKMAEAIKEARRKMHDQVQDGVTHSDMTSKEMRDDIAEYFAQAALDVVLEELVTMDMAIIARGRFDEAYTAEDMTVASSMREALKAAADKLKNN